MQRRTFLSGALALGLGGIGLKTLAGTMDMGMMEDSGSAALLSEDALPAGAALRDLSKLANASRQAGQFKGTLIAAPHSIELRGGQPTVFWTYNGGLPGPLIEVFEGDMVEITFVNRLKQPSSIHWHGLPVPPEQDGNPQQMVPPGGSKTYRFQLPEGSAGTYWYHPHPHNFTAEQVFRGLAGPFIVRVRHDPLTGIPERLLMVSDLKLDAHGAIAPNDNNDWMNGREGQFVLVNAQHRPVLRFDAGGRERWRVWNACSARYLRLQLPGSTLTLVGTDGGLIEQPQTGLKEVLLAPAQRVELIIDAAGRHDRVELSAAVHPRGKMGRVAPDKSISLLTVDFSGVGTASPPPLPAQLTTMSRRNRSAPGVTR